MLDIRTRNGQLSLFRQCLEVGASRHLQYAQKLSLLDVPIFECNRILRNKAPWIHGERDTLLLQILQSFPSNKLTTFRLASPFSPARFQSRAASVECLHGGFFWLIRYPQLSFSNRSKTIYHQPFTKAATVDCRFRAIAW